MIDVKEAVRIAIHFAKELIPTEDFDSITLEEVELAQHEPFWYVTLGFKKQVAADPLMVFTGKTANLIIRYKIFQINRDSGEVISMKIRKD